MCPDPIVSPILFFHAALFVEVCQLSSFPPDSRLFSLQPRRPSRIFIDTNGLIAAYFEWQDEQGSKAISIEKGLCLDIQPTKRLS